MQRVATIGLWVMRLTGVTQVILGLLFWSGKALALLPMHMLIGMTFVIALWVLAAIAMRAGVGVRWGMLAVLWGLVVPVFGIVHPQLLPGPAHWVVRVLHLLIGVAAMVIGTLLARHIRRRAEVGRSHGADVLAPA